MKRQRVSARTPIAFALPIILTAALLSVITAAPASAAPCDASGNQITCENSKPGTAPSVWDITGSGDSSIQGFATDISVNIGSRIDFKIDTDASAYTIDIYRTGWYQGLGARKIASVSPSATLPQQQPECISDATTELYDCGTWAVSASWAVPSTAVSGVYFALLTRTDTGGQSHITFIVRDLASHAQVLFQTSDPTWEAYNAYGGSDFYQGAAHGRAYKISYNRPFATRSGGTAHDFYFGNEYAAVRFLERNGYDITYIAGVDTDRFGSTLLNHEVFLSVGHDEYWSAKQRSNVEAARDAGVDLQFLSGNEVYWHTRYEPSIDSSKTAYRTLVSYKETWSNAKIDPSSEWTGTWRDPRFASLADGAGNPENGLTGTMYMSNNTDLAVTVNATEGKMRLWRNTSLATLAAGTSVALAPHTIGYESDEDVDNGFRPDGLIHLSTTTGAVPQYLQDFGSIVKPGTTTHHLTLYRAPSGALVFSAGSIQWSWGLDQEHDGNGAPADPRMQQAQVNLLADMGAQPASLVPPLVAASASSDTTAPVTKFTSPASGATVANGSQVTVSGTATDAGGQVAGVEVSTDAGRSWHAATGTANWSYSYVQEGSGSTVVRARAIDDSGNYASMPATLTLNVVGPFSVFGVEQPAVVDGGDAAAVELGLRFTPTINGVISGVRFFKSTANTGTHTGSLWNSTGGRLATVTFSGETASGWQSANFASAVPVTAGQTYVISYSAPSGHYALGDYYWAYRGKDAGPLTVAGGFGAIPAGVYSSSLGTFPIKSYHQGNYFVDAIFTDAANAPLVATSLFPMPGSSSVSPDAIMSAVLSKDIVSSSLTFTVKDAAGSAVSGATAYDSASRTATFTPSALLRAGATYTATIAATDTAGNPMSGTRSWSFTIATAATAEGLCPCTLFEPSLNPQILEDSDTKAVSLGVRFTANTAGTVTGVRFYKGPNNTGTHVGSLWDAAGTLLASATFTNESTSGWQSVTFSNPVSITAGKEYTASYRAPAGKYSATLGAFSGPYTRGPLSVPANGGAYSYTNPFPGTRVSTSYLVDLVFEPTATPITVVSQSPTNGATGIDPSSVISVTLSNAIADGYRLTASAAGTAVTGSTSLSTDRTTITFVPTQPMPTSTKIDVTLSNVTSSSGTSLPTQSWSFTTAATAPATTQYSLLTGLTPAVPAATDDSQAVELGMSFSTSVSGSVTAIKFYKGTGNTGTHTGSLWSASGQRLATVTFTGESASGWQTAQLSTPVALSVGATYVVSYFAPAGHYSYTANFFQSPRSSGPLTAGTTQNGRFVYGSAGGFPTKTWQASNYFVDVVFSTASSGTTSPATVTSTTPAAGATGVATTTAISAQLSQGTLAGTPTLAVTSAAGAVPGQSSYNSTTRVVSFTPSGALTASTAYTATVSVSGATPSGGTWSFTTASGTSSAVTVTATSPASGATGVAVGTNVTATLSAGVSGTPTLALAGPAGNVAGTSSYNATTRVITFDPSADLAASTAYTATVSASGSTPSGGTWSFTTAAATAPVTVTSTTPASGATDVDPTLSITAQLSAAPSTSPTLAVRSSAGAVAGALSYNQTTRVLTFTPSQPLAWSTQYTATVTIGGSTPSGGSWSFTTTAEPPTVDALTIFSANDVPQNPSWNDASAVQVGVRFSSSVAGSVTGIRFYKGAENSGVHQGYLWSATGQLLASVTFSSETGSGWQSATFSSPVAIQPGVEYRASYHSTVGRYSVDLNALTNPVTSGPLSTPASGGVYIYGTAFPSRISNHNYWVDVSFVPTA